MTAAYACVRARVRAPRQTAAHAEEQPSLSAPLLPPHTSLTGGLQGSVLWQRRVPDGSGGDSAAAAPPVQHIAAHALVHTRWGGGGKEEKKSGKSQIRTPTRPGAGVWGKVGVGECTCPRTCACTSCCSDPCLCPPTHPLTPWGLCDS